MTSFGGIQVDAYTLRARLYPAFLVALPVILLVFRKGEVERWGAVVLPVLGGLGVLFLASQLVRSRGYRVQERMLKPAWGGMPTTRMLRLADERNPVRRDHWRSRIQGVTGRTLPTRADEQSDRVGSDLRYEDAVRALITIVRASSSEHPRVQDENINYGFRRNLWAAKGLALITLLACGGIDALLVQRNGLALTAIPISVHLVAVIVWVFFITKSWVEEAGVLYATRLFETLDHPSM